MKTKYIIIFIATLVLGLMIGRWTMPSSEMEVKKGDSQVEHVHTDEVYTCSMHPQIRQPEFGQCPICAMDLVLVGSSGSNDPFITEMSLEASKLAQVQTTDVRSGGVNKELLLQGEIHLNEANERIISSRFPGRIERLLVGYEGMLVEKGQILAEVYSPELIAAQNEFLETLKFKNSQPAIVEAAKQKLILWDISEDQVKKIESTGSIIEVVTITSPYKGIVQKKYIQTGAYVNEGTSLFQIVDLATLWVVFDLYEEDIAWVQVGDEIEFRVTSFPTKEFKAKVSFIDPVMQGKSRTLKIRLVVDNKDYLLKPDMFVKGLLKGTMPSGIDQVIIPKTAVLWTGKRSVVYVEIPEGEVKSYTYREVVIAGDFGESYLIASGLSEGERVVTMGLFKVDAAAQLSGKYSMMNPPTVNNLISQIPISFKESLEAAFEHYIQLKNALVNSDLAKSNASMSKLYASFKTIEVSKLDPELKNYWDTWRSKLDESVNISSNYTELDEIRADFSNISDLLIILTEDLSFHSKKLFKSYCSMAFTDKGGYWLSEFEEIANPYYGESMLRCGTVEKVYK